MGTRRVVSERDRALFWQARNSGLSLKEAARVAGIHENTAARWDAKRRKAIAENELESLKADVLGSARNQHKREKLTQDLLEAQDLPPVIPHDRLCKEAARGLEDFDFFRRYYLGRVPSPWQVDAAYKLVQLLESDEKEFAVVNVAPGAGKSTLFHDVAVWAIVRNRAVRVLIGSVSQAMAKQYSQRIRQTLERPVPIEPDPELVRRGLALNAEGCLQIDYGRFKPASKGAIWRAEEFVVEQDSLSGLDNKEPTVRAYGFDSEFIGHRADLCLFDDVASPENAKDSAARDKLIERWDSMAEARVDPGGLLVVIGQRLGPQDLYAHCLSKVIYDDELDDYDGSDVTELDPDRVEPIKKAKYHHIKYQAYYEELDTGKESKRITAKPWPDGPLLDPYRLSWKDLSYIKGNNRNKFRVVYQQEDLELESTLCERTWLVGGMGNDGVFYPGCIDLDRQPGYVPSHLEQPLLSIGVVDPSPTKFWGIIWLLYQPSTKLLFVVDVARTKLTAEELIGYNVTSREYSGLMEDWQNRADSMGLPITHWVIEVNAAQRFLLAHDYVRKWQALHRVNILGHTTSANKIDTSLGVEALLPPLVRSGSVRLPSMRGNWKTMALVDELTSWTSDKKQGTDLVMALWMGVLNIPNLLAPELPPVLHRPSWLVSKYIGAGV